MRFLLSLLILVMGVSGANADKDEMGTPNINTIIEWVRSEYPDLPRIQTTNCRMIAGTATWSQHAWANAADIFVDLETGDELKARLLARYPDHIKVLLWQVAGHFDHIHIDTWPTGIGTPPCANGDLRVRHKDGTLGFTFTDDIVEGGDDMALTPKEENTVRDLLAALEANGAGTQASRQGLLDKTFKIANNYPVTPPPPVVTDGLKRGDSVTLQ